MIKRNYREMPWVPEEACHGGRGTLRFRRVLEQEFESCLTFLDYTVMSPGTSIGYHRHLDSEEVYVILDGTGVMTVDGEEAVVGPGDVVLNRCGGSHGLVNTGQSDLKILVFEGKIEKTTDFKVKEVL